MPTLQRLADNGLMYSQWHTTALCSPTRSTLLTGRNHHLNGMAAITEAATGFPGAHGRIPDECATVGQILQDGGWSTFWLGKNHNVPETGRLLRRQQEAVAAPEGLRSLLRLHRRRDQPVVSRPGRGQPVHRAAVQSRRRAITSPRTSPTRPSRMIRDQKASNPSQAVVHVVLPGRQPCAAPRPAGIHRQVQGQVRRRLRGLSRVGPAAHDRQGHPAEGHPAHAAQPDARGRRERRRLRAPVGLAQRRREEAVLAPDGGLRRILRVHRRAGRPHHRLPREERPAREHARLLRRRQRRVGRGQPQRLGQREQVLQRLSRTSSPRT